MFQRLLANKTYEHRICGLPRNVATQMRDLKQLSDLPGLTAVGERYKALLPPTVSFGIAFGSAMKEEVVQTQWTEDVVLYLLSDPTNVDSKMVTFVSTQFAAPQREKLFAALYRKDVTLPPQ